MADPIRQNNIATHQFLILTQKFHYQNFVPYGIRHAGSENNLLRIMCSAALLIAM